LQNYKNLPPLLFNKRRESKFEADRGWKITIENLFLLPFLIWCVILLSSMIKHFFIKIKSKHWLSFYWWVIDSDIIDGSFKGVYFTKCVLGWGSFSLFGGGVYCGLYQTLSYQHYHSSFFTLLHNFFNSSGCMKLAVHTIIVLQGLLLLSYIDYPRRCPT